MGAVVASVGASVGAVVGASVGAVVGAAVGAVVGAWVGAVVAAGFVSGGNVVADGSVALVPDGAVVALVVAAGFVAVGLVVAAGLVVADGSVTPGLLMAGVGSGAFAHPVTRLSAIAPPMTS